MNKMEHGKVQTMQLPFHRYCLSEQLRATAKPSNVPLETWTLFWESLTPLLCQIKQKDALLHRIKLIVTYALTVIMIIVLFVDLLQQGGGVGENYSRVVVIATSFVATQLVLIALLRVYSIRTKLANLEKLQLYCNERQFMFSSYVLECRLEKIDERPVGYRYYLYVFDRRNNTNNNEEGVKDSYVSFDISTERVTCCVGRNDKSTTIQPDYLPAGLESISVTDWNDFWSKIEQNFNQQYAVSSRMQCLSLSLLFFFVFATYFSTGTLSNNTNLVLYWCVLVLGIVSSIGVCTVTSELERLHQQQREILLDFQERFRGQRVYMESCRVTTRHWLFGYVSQHNVYFYPIQNNL